MDICPYHFPNPQVKSRYRLELSIGSLAGITQKLRCLLEFPNILQKQILVLDPIRLPAVPRFFPDRNIFNMKLFNARFLTRLFNTKYFSTILFNTILFSTILLNTEFFNTEFFNTEFFNTKFLNKNFLTRNLLTQKSSRKN